MLVAAALQAVTNQFSAGLMTLAPIICHPVRSRLLQFTPAAAFGYVLAGGVFGWLLVRC